MNDNTRTFTRRTVDGGIAIRSKIGPSQKRKGYEKNLYFPAIEFGLDKYDLSHSQPAQLGVEKKEGILFAPREVNRSFQVRVEKYIRQIYENKRDDVDIYLTTETIAHPMTLRLQEITYSVEAVTDNKLHTLFEATIEVENKKVDPRVSVRVLPISDAGQFLKPKPKPEETTQVIE